VALWTLDYTTTGPEAVPVILAVTMNADATIILHLSKDLVGDVSYTVTGPEDLAGIAPTVAFLGCGATWVDGAEQQLGVYQELLPPGPIWETESDPSLYLLMLALSQEAARLYAQTNKLVVEGNPVTSVEMVPEWEVVFGLPDDCAPPPTTLAGRRAAVASAFLSRGGQTVGYYLGLLEVIFGLTATIDENYPGLPFTTGTGQEDSGSEAGDHLYSVSDALTWRLNMYGYEVGTQEMVDRIECLINRVKPTHTNVTFNYVGPGQLYADVTAYYQTLGLGTMTGANPLGAGSVSLAFWLNVGSANTLEVAFQIGTLDISFTLAVGGFTLNMVGALYANPTVLLGNTWHSVIIAKNGTGVRLFINNVGWQVISGTPDLSGSIIFFVNPGQTYRVANIFGVQRTLDDYAERRSLFAAGRTHDPRDASGLNWAGGLVPLLWRDADAAGTVVNVGTGGTAALVFAGDVTSED